MFCILKSDFRIKKPDFKKSKLLKTKLPNICSVKKTYYINEINHQFAIRESRIEIFF